MVTSRRIDRLENAGLVHRERHPTDRRGIRIELTDAGRELVDRVTTAYGEPEPGARMPFSRGTRSRSKLLASLTGTDSVEADARPAPRRSGRDARRIRARRALEATEASGPHKLT